ncbi:putative malonate decarboxylase (fragment) [Ralstonia solanacearum K60]
MRRARPAPASRTWLRWRCPRCGARGQRASARTTRASTPCSPPWTRWTTPACSLASQAWPDVKLALHDFGATPAVVRLRLEQALEAVVQP